MSHLFRPTYTQDIPKGATIRTAKGVKIATWMGRGQKKIEGVVSEDGARCTVTSDCWHLSYTDASGRRKTKKLYPDRKASEKKAATFLEKLDRIDAGIEVPGGTALDERTLLQLVDDWGKHLARRGKKGKHVPIVTIRVKKVIAELGIHRPEHIAKRAVERWLVSHRSREECSAQTMNHYLTNLRTFTRWLVKEDILPSDPLAGIEKLNADRQRTFERRSLTDEEIGRLLTAAETDTVTRRGLTGPTRAAAYRIAIYTGLRRGEIAQLRRSWFRLDNTPPTINLPATATKNGQAVSQIVPDHVAASLRPWLVTVDEMPFADWGIDHAASALRDDLRNAGIEPETDAGRVDFHALRATFVTLLARASIPIQHAQRLARLSSPAIMMKHYAKLGEQDLAEKVADLGKPAPETDKGQHK